MMFDKAGDGGVRKSSRVLVQPDDQFDQNRQELVAFLNVFVTGRFSIHHGEIASASF